MTPSGASPRRGCWDRRSAHRGDRPTIRSQQALTERLAGQRLLDDDDIERLEQRIEAQQPAEGLMHVIQTLNPRDREALLLIGVDGLTPTQAAGVLGISAAKCRMRFTAARRAVGESLQTTGATTATPRF